MDPLGAREALGPMGAREAGAVAGAPVHARSLAEFWCRRAEVVQLAKARAARAAVREVPEVCIYWMKNRCTSGNVCSFLHLYVPSKVPVCAYFLQNAPCPDGTQCLFRHWR